MLVFAAAIVFQVTCVQVAADTMRPYFMGYMEPSQTTDEDPTIPTQFIAHNQIGFNSSATFNFTQFRINDQGIYWISLRPVNPRATYLIKVNRRMIAATDYETKLSGVGFARYLRRGDTIEVTKVFVLEHLSTRSNGDFGMFSIALLKRADNEGEAAAAFWTASYYWNRIDTSISSQFRTVIFQHKGGLNSRDGQMTWNYTAPWTGWYWAGIRAVPDGYGRESVMEFQLQVNQNRILYTWIRKNPLKGSYASRVIYLNANDVVTVLSNWRYSDGYRKYFGRESMVSVVALTVGPGSSMLLVSRQPRPPPQQQPEEPLPPWYAWKPFLRFGRDASTAAGNPCGKTVSFNFVQYDPSHLMETSAYKTVTIQVTGHYLISLRNAPRQYGQSTMVVYAMTSDRETHGYLMVVEAHSPEDIANARGADGVFFLVAGDRLWVRYHYSPITTSDTFWSLALLQNYTGAVL